MINIPPIVGVFVLLKCRDGPSVLIFCNKFNRVIILKPYFVITKEIKLDIRKILIIIKLLKM